MQRDNLPVIFLMVGLPCRGKSYWSKHLRTFMSQQDIEVKIFNLGEFRRKSQAEIDEKSKFFEKLNKDNETDRNFYAQMALDEMIQYLKDNENCIAIYDGTNTTVERRNYLRQQLCNDKYIVVWVEMNSQNIDRIDQYIKQSKIFNADYIDSKMTEQQKFEDFKKRIKSYEDVYVPFQESEKQIVENDKFQHYLHIEEFGEKVDKKEIYG